MRTKVTTLVVLLLAASCAALLIMACGPIIATPTPIVSHGHPTALAQAVTSPVVSTATVPGTATTVPATATTVPTAPAVFTGDRIYVYDTSGPGLYLVFDSLSGQVERSLPAGTPNVDWTLLYTATIIGDQTKIEAIEVATGASLRSLTLDGRFVLPVAGAGGLIGGLSGDGRTLILAALLGDDEVKAFERDNRWVSRFAVLDTGFGKTARTVELDGNYSYDTLAPTGNFLYLIEHRPPVHPTEEYAVRAYDFAAGALRPGAVVDKASARQVMEGTPGEQVVSRDGQWVYTLYRNSDYGPFVHALNVTNQYAMCIDLPKAGKEDGAAALLWGLALSANGTTLYAVNGVLGQAVEISTGDQSIRRSVAFPPNATAPDGPLAKLGAWLVPSAAAKRLMLNSAALAPDGRTLYVLGEQGILVLDTATLAIRQRLVPAAPFNSIAVSTNGAELYVVGEAGQLERRDAATGAVIGAYSVGSPLLGVLRVEAKR